MWCTLCGVPCAPAECRLTPTRDLQGLLRPRCVPTAFHYAALMALSPEERRPVCFHCLNWKRHCRRDRRNTVRAYHRRKTYTPFDSILMHALTPGHFPEPDRRCLGRLLRVAADPFNAFASLVPAPARVALERAAAETQDRRIGAVLRGWWDLNEGSSFFRTSGSARAVRAMLRGG